MQALGWLLSAWRTKTGYRRDRIAAMVALVTIGCLSLAFVFSDGTQFLMPGPLTSTHGAIKECSTCHTQTGTGKVSWVHGLVVGDRRADSNACLSCHKMPDTAYNAHGASTAVLDNSTKRLTKIAKTTPVPLSARAQKMAFPTRNVSAGGLACASCHQEHRGAKSNLKEISNEQCHSCHAVQFDSFDGNHPQFENYPFKRRTPIVYDHAGHFRKHYPELAAKDPAKPIPATCSSCHNSKADKRIMAVAPFETTCAACHLDGITGKDRVSGPKGIAFLALPGLDLQSLKKRSAPIGEWPEESEAKLTPFMKVMIARTERGRRLIESVDTINLQDLAEAKDAQITAVTSLVWEIKSLFHALITQTASDALSDLNPGKGVKLNSVLVADLTASIPRDVIINAQQQWLPNLAAEIANGPNAVAQGTVTQEAVSQDASTDAAPADIPDATAPQEEPAAEAAPSDAETDVPEENGEVAAPIKRDPPACLVSILGQCLVPAEEGGEPAAPGSSTGAVGTTGAAQPEDIAPALSLPAALAEAPISEDAIEVIESRVELLAGSTGKKADQSDELLNLTEDEVREMKALGREFRPGKAGSAGAGAADTPARAGADPQTQAAAPVGIDSKIDPESWADYGGWYSQDYEIVYRPVGHKDKFVYTWLVLTGLQSPKGSKGPAAAVFDFLTNKEAPGSCTKCHSVDDNRAKGRSVNFSPTSVDGKSGRFTNFIHEPHFNGMEDGGCLTCHKLDNEKNYLSSYEHGDVRKFQSNFSAVKKDLCQSCHTKTMARQDCLLCHQYHVNGVITPITETKNPTK